MKHGKEEYIDFDDETLKTLRECFNSLDEDGSGTIGTDELEEPLVALGLVDSWQQVMKIVEQVDDDKSGYIEFGEFLKIIKGGKRNMKNGQHSTSEQTGAIFEFF
mgnify:CR=1 FL=1